MQNNYAFKLAVPAILFGLVLSVPCFAQGGPAGQEMNQAGQKMEQAGSDTADAAKDAYHGTARAVKDTTITARVKTALASDKNVKAAAIHVVTVAGVVTLNGQVPSPEVAQQVAQLAEQTKGVQGVNNQLMVASSESAD
jgi:hyperosmotically inducible periplasmic protein